MDKRRIVCSLVMIALAATPAFAEPEKAKGKGGGKEPEPQAAVAAYERAATPGEAHKLLQKMVGKWTVAMKSWMVPGQPAVESTGTAEVKSLLGDRFVQM